MHPILLELGPIKLYSYGLMIAIAFLTGTWLSGKLAKRVNIDPQFAYDTAFWVIVAGLAGSRIVYILTEPDYFMRNPLAALKPWEGGFVFYGGLIGAVIAVLVRVHRHNVDLWQLLDIAAPAGALGHSIGRLGCFFAGCCYGKPTDMPWAITFNNPQGLAPLGIPIHPTQLYSSANELFLFIILMILWSHRKFKGQIWWTWVGLYAIGRSIIEIFRGDPRGAYFDGLLSTSQIIAAFALLIAIFFYFRNRKLYFVR